MTPVMGTLMFVVAITSSVVTALLMASYRFSDDGKLKQSLVAFSLVVLVMVMLHFAARHWQHCRTLGDLVQ